jgi:hypothetical protein
MRMRMRRSLLFAENRLALYNLAENRLALYNLNSSNSVVDEPWLVLQVSV